MNGQDPFEAGMATRKAVLGETHVARAEAARDDFDGPFQDLITRGAWGGVWARDTISRRERSMITIALLAALGHDEELAMHCRATARTGASREDVCEALLHVAIYAGVPARKVKDISRELISGEIERIANNYIKYAGWYKAE